jgi:hypothetical protein
VDTPATTARTAPRTGRGSQRPDRLPIRPAPSSLGVALWRQGDETVNAWLKATDAALYRAKSLGRTRFTLRRNEPPPCPTGRSSMSVGAVHPDAGLSRVGSQSSKDSSAALSSRAAPGRKARRRPVTETQKGQMKSGRRIDARTADLPQ